MKIEIRRRRLMVFTRWNIFTFGLTQPFFIRFSLKKVEAAIKKLVEAQQSKLQAADSWSQWWSAYTKRGAENATRAGAIDIRRYSKMLDMYQRTGTCEGWGGQCEQATVDLSQSTSSDAGTS